MSDLIPLAQAHCMPRKGSEHKLTQARIQELLPQVPGWKLAEDGQAALGILGTDAAGEIHGWRF